MQPWKSENVFNQPILMIYGFLGYRNRQRALKYKKKVRDKLVLSNIRLTGVSGKRKRELEGRTLWKKFKEP